jgi:L-threonylcarbamoyladenylate synthase
MVAEVADCLRAGGIVLLPTDTVYGLAAMPTAAAAVSRIYELKGRPGSRNLPIMVHAGDEIAGLGGDINGAAARLLRSDYVPGPLTLAVGLIASATPDWLSGRDEAAFRVPDDDWLRSVLADVGPLLVTSANPHAELPRESVPEILATLTGAPDLAVDGGVRAGLASTLVNCRAVPPVVERVGAVPAADIEAVLR